MKRALAVTVTVVAVQVALVCAWLVVDQARNPQQPIVFEGGATLLTTPMRELAPDLELRRFGGATTLAAELRDRADTGTGLSPVLVHFWATWCAPCREELPNLLDYTASSGITLLAASVDSDWATVRNFLGDDIPEAVVLASGDDVVHAFDVRELPATFVVDGEGWLRLRLDGARDWASPATREAVSAAVSEP